MLRELHKKHNEQFRKYGEVGAPISAIFQGIRYVAVGSKLIPFDTKKTYLDFIGQYMKSVTGAEWGNAELDKSPDNQHQIIKLYRKVAEIQKTQAKNKDGLYVLDKTGSLQAWYQLAYDLHVLSHYSTLHELVLKRLKLKDQYQGARYELSVTAAMIRAGFEIEHQDEQDISSKHYEFTATHNRTGQKVAVEAKSKHRPGVLDYPGERSDTNQPKIYIGDPLGRALKKPSKYPLVVFVDLNLPPMEEDFQNSQWIRELKKTISNKEKQYKDGMPANAFIFTNHPHHYEDEETANPLSSWMLTRVANPRIPIKHPEILDAIALALNQYGNIPNFFEDQKT